MNKKIKQVVSESKIIKFCANLNKNLLLYFYNSQIYQFFIKIHNFFVNSILKNVNKSLIISSTKNISKHIKLKDIGWFIVLVVLFNTLAMMFLKKEIDVFSVSARIFFFLLGIILVFKSNRKP